MGRAMFDLPSCLSISKENAMRIALFILGALAAGYLIIKGFKQMLEENRQNTHGKDDQPQLPKDDDH